MAATSSATITPPQQAQDILVSKIRVGPRLRELDQTWALALSGIMNDEGGQRTPVDVYPVPGTDEFVLGPGLHRLAARKIGGHETVRAFVLSDASDLERRSREVSENLWRKALDPLERAAFVAELVELQRIKAGLGDDETLQSVAAKARWEPTLKGDADDAILKMRIAFGITQEIADQIGLSRPSVYRDLDLHRSLQPDVAQRLTAENSDLRRNASQLQALAKLDPAMQRQVAGEIIEGRAKTVSDAVQQLTPGTVKPSAEAKRLSTVLATMARMGRAERKAALETLISMYGAEAADV